MFIVLFVCFVFHCVLRECYSSVLCFIVFKSVVGLLGVAGIQAPLATGASVERCMIRLYSCVVLALCYTCTVLLV